MLLLPLMLHHDSEPSAGETDNGPKERGGAEGRAALRGCRHLPTAALHPTLG